MADTNISADPIVLATTVLGDPSFGGVFIRDPSLDITWDCHERDRYGNWDRGVIQIPVTPYGIYLNQTIWVTAIPIIVMPEGSYIAGIVITPALIQLTVLPSASYTYTQPLQKNWVKWTNVGRIDFTIWKDNIAGEMPLDWAGWIYEIKKLHNQIIVYGENGVSILTPAGNTYALRTIYRLGLKGKQAVSGDETIHFFIDKEGKLWGVSFPLTQLGGRSETFEKIDYSEYLSTLNNPVLSWDSKNRLLYICDGVQGFIYNAEAKSLGQGPINITGLGYREGTLYVAAPTTILTPIFEAWTDIYDMGVRKGKSIESLEFGINLTVALQAAVRYRLNKDASFSQTDWFTVDSEGRAFFQCYGVEFQFGVKAASYEWLKLDYWKVKGKVFDLW